MLGFLRGPWLAAGTALLVVSVAFSAGWAAGGRAGAADASEARREAAEARREAAEAAVAERARSGAIRAEIEKETWTRISDAKKEAERLRGCIDRGHGCGLRVKIAAPTCPDVPAPGTAASVGGGGGEWAELDADARLAYFALRDRVETVEGALRMCVSMWGE